MPAALKFANPFATATDLYVFADAVQEDGHDGRADEYRQVAREMKRAPQFVTELNEVRTVHDLLDRVRRVEGRYCYTYVRCLKTTLEGRCTDGRMAFHVMPWERRRLRRTRMTPDQWERKYDWTPARPYPVDQVWPGQYGERLTFDGIEVSRKWPGHVPPFILVRLGGYTVWAYQYGFLCRRYPTAAWYAGADGGPLCLVEDGKIVAIVMHQG